MHNTLCTYLGECSYPPRREVQLLLLHSREQGALLAAVNATLARCVTGWPAVYRDDTRLLSKVGGGAHREMLGLHVRLHTLPCAMARCCGVARQTLSRCRKAQRLQSFPSHRSPAVVECPAPCFSLNAHAQQPCSRFMDAQTVLLERAWSGIGPQCHAQRGCYGCVTARRSARHLRHDLVLPRPRAQCLCDCRGAQQACARSSASLRFLISPSNHLCPPCSDTEYGTLRGDKRASMPPAALQSWRERLGACYNFDVHTPARTQPKTVLIVDRPYEAGGLSRNPFVGSPLSLEQQVLVWHTVGRAWPEGRALEQHGPLKLPAPSPLVACPQAGTC